MGARGLYIFTRCKAVHTCAFPRHTLTDVRSCYSHTGSSSRTEESTFRNLFVKVSRGTFRGTFIQRQMVALWLCIIHEQCPDRCHPHRLDEKNRIILPPFPIHFLFGSSRFVFLRTKYVTAKRGRRGQFLGKGRKEIELVLKEATDRCSIRTNVSCG